MKPLIRQLCPHMAACYPKVPMCIYLSDTKCAVLCSQGACVNLNTLDMVSPLHGACTQGHTACAKLLMENGANVSKASSCGVGLFVVFDWIHENLKFKMVCCQFLLERDSQFVPITTMSIIANINLLMGDCSKKLTEYTAAVVHAQ